MDDLTKQEHDSIEHFTPPPLEEVESIVRPLRYYFTPEFFGIEHVDPAKPYMFVTNHTVYGITDGLFFGAELYKKLGIYLRPLVDNLHFEIPYWREKALQLGFVRASREHCAALMKAGQNILVFPGGEREAWKHRGEAYKLIWKDHLGFAKMAIEHGYTILPVAQVGGDDAFDIVADADDIMHSFIGKYLKRSGIAEKYLHKGDNIPPISRGLFGLPGIPKPVKIYIAFGEPLETENYEHRSDDEKTLWLVRNKTQLAMDKLMLQLLEYRSSDKKVGFIRRILSR